ncbi:MAG: hypothetical protein Kapaf2KO_16610 [Candidatus Kapaibacteriales bacterium]
MKNLSRKYLTYIILFVAFSFSNAYSIEFKPLDRVLEQDTSVVFNIANRDMLMFGGNFDVNTENTFLAYYYSLRDSLGDTIGGKAGYRMMSWGHDGDSLNTISINPFDYDDITYDAIIEPYFEPYVGDMGTYKMYGNTTNKFDVNYENKGFDVSYDKIRSNQRRGTELGFVAGRDDVGKWVIDTNFSKGGAHYLPNTNRILAILTREDPRYDPHEQRAFIGITHSSYDLISGGVDEEGYYMFIGTMGTNHFTNTYNYVKALKIRKIELDDPLFFPDRFDTRPMASTSVRQLWGIPGNYSYWYWGYFESERSTEPDEEWTDLINFRKPGNIPSYPIRLPYKLKEIQAADVEEIGARYLYAAYESKEIDSDGDVLFPENDTISHGSGIGLIKTFDFFNEDFEPTPIWTWEFDGKGGESIVDFDCDSTGNIALLIAEETDSDIPMMQNSLSGEENGEGVLKLLKIDKNGNLTSSVEIMRGVFGAETGKIAQVQYLKDTVYVFAQTRDGSAAMAGGSWYGPKDASAITVAAFIDSKVRSEVVMPTSPCSWDDITVRVIRNRNNEKSGRYLFQISQDTLFNNTLTVFEGEDVVPSILSVTGNITVPPGEYYHRLMLDGHITELSDEKITLQKMPWIDVVQDQIAFCSGTNGRFNLNHSGIDEPSIVFEGDGLEVENIGFGEFSVSSFSDGSFRLLVKGGDGSCEVSDTLDIEVGKEIDILAPSLVEVCGTGLPYSIFDIAEIFPKGGYFIGGSVDSLGIIDTLDEGTYEVTYIYDVADGCWDSKNITLNVSTPEKPVLQYEEGELRAENYTDAGNKMVWEYRQSGSWIEKSRSPFYVPKAEGRYRAFYENESGCRSELSSELFIDKLWKDPKSITEYEPKRTSTVSAHYHRGDLYLEANSGIIGRITLIDLSGRTIYSGRFGSTKAMVSLNLIPGTYFITTENGLSEPIMVR